MMFRALTDDEQAAIKTAKDWANAELKRPRKEAQAFNAEIRKLNKGLPRSLRKPYVKVPKTPKLVSGQPVWIRTKTTAGVETSLLIDYELVRAYVRKLKASEWRVDVAIGGGQRGAQALEIRYQHASGRRRGRVVFEQIRASHRVLLERRELPTINLVGA